jgi:hypothetical protein
MGHEAARQLGVDHHMEAALRHAGGKLGVRDVRRERFPR